MGQIRVEKNVGGIEGLCVITPAVHFQKNFYHANDEGGLAWSAPEIGIQWPKVEGAYQGTASAKGYSVDGVALNLSDKDQKWLGLKDTFKF